MKIFNNAIQLLGAQALQAQPQPQSVAMQQQQQVTPPPNVQSNMGEKL